MQENIKKFIQQNSPDGGFLQSPEWRKFQESVGRKTYNIPGENFRASIIEHRLPVVGKYFYISRGPIVSLNMGHETYNINSIINLAKKENVGWVRIEPAISEILEVIKKNIKYKIVKAPHDMQPKEILVMDIAKSEEEILSQMKPKTRYNIRLAGKKGVKVFEDRKYMDEFIKLTKITAKRQGIIAHPDEYYRKMAEIIPENMLKLYIAECQGKIIAANLTVFYGNTCTYLHGASYNEYRNVMAPYLLQWKQIQDAKDAGCKKYDFGGIKSYNIKHKTYNNNSWEGITRFKLGFASDTRPVEFPGCYDVVINHGKYCMYRLIQKLKSLIR
ncbi:MAG TPA: peptidoglycan bridge formation glycyltransferase FemA/FemB family protein [Candidatus Moranbacteria bacterium]|nr:peptidoglycan bridge formation glycyltransferase FemA/FemB family protein [Candidatus Moranbacteria bacterium]